MSGFQIRSPNYPNDYEDGLDCQLTVTLAEGLRIRVQFDSFYTYSGLDWLDIRDNSDFGDIISVASGINYPTIVLSPSNSIKLIFHSKDFFTWHSKDPKKGFQLTIDTFEG